MMPRVNQSSAWSTGSVLERVLLLVIGAASTATAVVLLLTGHRSICFAVLAIAAVATVGFVFTAITDVIDPAAASPVVAAVEDADGLD